MKILLNQFRLGRTLETDLVKLWWPQKIGWLKTKKLSCRR